MDYSKTKDIIIQSGFLSDKDELFVSDNIDAIQLNWEKRQVFRTETEMRVSVLTDIKHPTNASKYWQCVREQAVFYENLVVLSFDYRRNQIEQKQLVKKIDSEGDNLERSLLQIDLEEKQFAQLNMKQVSKDRMREICLWAKIMNELDDGSFNTSDVNEHQLVSYGLRFQGQMENVGNASPSEMSNLVGQFNTTMRHLDEAGLLVKKDNVDEIC